MSKPNAGLCVGLAVAILLGWAVSATEAAPRRKRAKRNKPAVANPVADRPDTGLQFMPDDCRLLATLNPATILQSDVLKQVAAANPSASVLSSVEEELGLDVSQIERVIFGSPLGVDSLLAEASFFTDADQLTDFLFVVEFKTPVDANAMLAKIGNTAPYAWEADVTVGRFTYRVWQSDPAMAFCFADDRTLVGGTKELLQAVLERDAPPKLPEELAAAYAESDQTQAAFVGIFLKDIMADLLAKTSVLPVDVLRGMDVLVIDLDLDSRLRFRTAIRCSDETVAYQLEGMFAAAWTIVRMQLGDDAQQSAAVASIVDSLKYAVNDRSFVFQLSIPAELLVDAQVGDTLSGVASLAGSATPSMFPIGHAQFVPSTPQPTSYPGPVSTGYVAGAPMPSSSATPGPTTWTVPPGPLATPAKLSPSSPQRTSSYGVAYPAPSAGNTGCTLPTPCTAPPSTTASPSAYYQADGSAYPAATPSYSSRTGAGYTSPAATAPSRYGSSAAIAGVASATGDTETATKSELDELRQRREELNSQLEEKNKEIARLQRRCARLKGRLSGLTETGAAGISPAPWADQAPVFAPEPPPPSWAPNDSGDVTDTNKP